MSRSEQSGGWAPLPTPHERTSPNHEAERPPLSKAAVTGFACALVFFIPLLTQVLGLVFGAVGLVKTRQRRRRGKGLAIAAIPISLLLAIAWVALLGFVRNSYAALGTADRQVLAALRASGEERSRLIGTLYDHRMSETFKGRVDRARFDQWADGLRTRHGQLQESRRDPRKPLESLGAGRLQTRHVGDFVNGGAAIAIQYSGLAADDLRVDDIQVDGRSAASE